MTPKPGEVYLVDLGLAGKVRPVVIVTREDATAPQGPQRHRAVDQPKPGKPI